MKLVLSPAKSLNFESELPCGCKEICKEGELAASMYILKSGKLSRYKGNQFKGSITKGESFEEYASLSKGGVRKFTIKTVEDV